MNWMIKPGQNPQIREFVPMCWSPLSGAGKGIRSVILEGVQVSEKNLKKVQREIERKKWGVVLESLQNWKTERTIGGIILTNVQVSLEIIIRVKKNSWTILCLEPRINIWSDSLLTCRLWCLGPSWTGQQTLSFRPTNCNAFRNLN